LSPLRQMEASFASTLNAAVFSFAMILWELLSRRLLSSFIVPEVGAGVGCVVCMSHLLSFLLHSMCLVCLSAFIVPQVGAFKVCTGCTT
jgi:hypothetical protein